MNYELLYAGCALAGLAFVIATCFTAKPHVHAVAIVLSLATAAFATVCGHPGYAAMQVSIAAMTALRLKLTP